MRLSNEGLVYAIRMGMPPRIITGRKRGQIQPVTRRQIKEIKGILRATTKTFLANIYNTSLLWALEFVLHVPRMSVSIVAQRSSIIIL